MSVETKEAQIKVNMTIKQKEKLAGLAKRNQMSLSKFVFELIQIGLKPQDNNSSHQQEFNHQVQAEILAWLYEINDHVKGKRIDMTLPEKLSLNMNVMEKRAGAKRWMKSRERAVERQQAKKQQVP